MKVLFIGNSYTYVNDLPKMVSDAAASVGVDIEVWSNVKGGGILSERLDENNDMFLKLNDLYSKEDFDVIAECIHRCIVDFENKEEIQAMVNGICEKYPLYK